jgi:SPP1 family phage portal protein
MDTQTAIAIVEYGSLEMLNQVVTDMKESNKKVEQYTRKCYKEYSGNVEIQERSFEDPLKINNKLKNDFRGDIVDNIVGYAFGKPIQWRIDEGNYTKGALERIQNRIKRFKKTNFIAELDRQTAEDMSICGRAFRLLYIDRKGQERAVRIKPWEAVVVEDATIDEVTHALIYYEMIEIKNGQSTTLYKAEFYDRQNVTYLVSTYDGKYILDPAEPINPKPHMYKGVPVIEFQNNNLLLSDFDKVSTLIDAYDRTVSDVQNELEEFRLAYLAFFGVEPTPAAMKAARQSGAFGMDVGEDIKFITKQLSIEAVKDHRQTLEKNIYQFSKTVNMSDEKFSGSQQSGDSRRWKLLPVENKAITKVSKFTKGLQQQIQLLVTNWSKKGEIKLDPFDVEFVFTRNIPVEQIYQADIAQKINGIASEETTLSFIPGVEDVQQEIERKKKDAIKVSAQPAEKEKESKTKKEVAENAEK